MRATTPRGDAAAFLVQLGHQAGEVREALGDLHAFLHDTAERVERVPRWGHGLVVAVSWARFEAQARVWMAARLVAPKPDTAKKARVWLAVVRQYRAHLAELGVSG